MRARRRRWGGESGQALPVVLSLVTLLFLLGGALAASGSTALRAATAGKVEGDDLYAADGGLELGIWWQRTGQPGNPPAQTINGRTVTTTVTATGGVLCTAPTPIRMTGFEHGAASINGGGLFQALTGATIDGATRRSGAYSLQVPDTSTSTASSASWTVSASPLVARFAIRLSSLPGANVAELATFGASAGGAARLGYVAASNRFSVQIGSGPAVAGSSAVSAGTWHVVDIRFTVTSNPRTVAWRVDGVDQTAATSSEAAAASVTTVRLGSATVADAFTANYDDVALSATSGDYPLAVESVLALRPDGNGTHAGAASFANDDGTAIDATSPGRLAESPMTTSGSSVHQTVVAATSYVELTFGDTAASCIPAVSAVLAYRASNSSMNSGGTFIMVGATARTLFSGDMATTQLSYRSAMVAPVGAAWTQAAVNALGARIGFSSDVAPEPSWEALLLEYATAPAVPATITVVATAGGSTVTATYTDAGASAPTLTTWTTTR